jgi:putative ABC transport system permease protein
MPLLPRLSSLWRNLLHKDRVDQELSEEVRSYLEMLIEAKVREGLKPEEARRAALIELGGVDQVKERVREIRMGQKLETIWQDLRFGARSLLKNPGFTLVAVITLGLGIGANTAIFSVVNAALLRQLPYDATRLVAVEASNPQKEARGHGASPGDFWDWQEQSRTFEQLTLYSGGGIGLKESERVEMISGALLHRIFHRQRIGMGRAHQILAVANHQRHAIGGGVPEGEGGGPEGAGDRRAIGRSARYPRVD